MSKKTRGPNFSSNEKEVLVNLIIKYKEVVENKRTDAATTAMKNEGWKKLTEEFNSLSSFSVRNIEQLKTCWDNIKRIRKDKAKAKKEIFSTGEGRPNLPPLPGPVQGQVEEVLGLTPHGPVKPLDSDAQSSEIEQCNISGKPMIIDSEIEDIKSNIVILEMSQSRDDCSKLVQESSDMMLPGTSKSNAICSQLVPENEPADPLGISREDECSVVVPEDAERRIWSGWSPAALKTKVTDTLRNTKDGQLWLKRRRPKSLLYDNLLQSKLELVEIMKKHAESEGTTKKLILEEQLKQEKIKTEILTMQLKKEQIE